MTSSLTPTTYTIWSALKEPGPKTKKTLSAGSPVEVVLTPATVVSLDVTVTVTDPPGSVSRPTV